MPSLMATSRTCPFPDRVRSASAARTPIARNVPPPPKLPELNQLKAKIADNDEGSLGADDMFKNIK